MLFSYNFLLKRLSKIIIPFVVAIFLCQIVFHADGKQLEVTSTPTLSLLKMLLEGNPDVLLPYSWFPFAIIYFYVCFYIVYRYLTGDIEYGLFYLLFSTILYMCITKYLFGWSFVWYVRCFAFNAGLLWKYNEKVILIFLQKDWYWLFTLTLLPFVAVLFNWKEMASAPLYPTFILILFSLVKKIPNIKLFSYLGTVSYEIYLLQGIPMKLLRGNHIHIQNDYIFILLTLIITIVLATVLHRGIAMLRK
ncbi:MAG: acyltransferase [Planctomycetaceae bacterium]|nr:acyltransferase [Planctomycetaceae bacterium]